MRSGEAEPTPTAYRRAVRDVVRHCLYAVDRNPLAVDLCKVALWLESQAPGVPLSFLDHRVRCGDALVGVLNLTQVVGGIPDGAFQALGSDDFGVLPADDGGLCRRLRSENVRDRRKLAGQDARRDLEAFAKRLATLDAMDERDPTEVAAKERRFRDARESDPAWAKWKLACDLWCSAFFRAKRPETATLAPTSAAVWQALTLPAFAQSRLAAHATSDADDWHYFHWQLEFPEVMVAGGFDIMLGNPPWETLSPDVKEFFATYDPQVRFSSPKEQKTRAQRLLVDGAIRQRWINSCNKLYRSVQFFKRSGRYQMFASGNLGKGDFNIYRMFVECAFDATKRDGIASQIVPENFYNGANATAIRKHLFSAMTLERLLCLENRREVWFRKVDSRMKFALYVARKGGHTESFPASFGVTSLERLTKSEELALTIPVALIREFSPDAEAVMEFSNQFEVEIARKMYARFPKFGEQIEGAPNRDYDREVDMGTDRGLFDEDPSGLPVYEGRMVAAFDYRAKGYRCGRGRKADWVDLHFGDPAKSIQPQWYIAENKLPAKLGQRPFTYRIAFCDVGSPTNERSLMAAMVPQRSVCGHTTPTIVFDQSNISVSFAWLGFANSLCVDFIVRMKASLHISYTLLDSLPLCRAVEYDADVARVARRAALLSCDGPEMAELWQVVREDPWIGAAIQATADADSRAVVQAEIDALVACLYGLDRRELHYILRPADVLGEDCGIETFKRLQLNEERDFGEYRTRRLVLEAWDRFVADGTFDPERDGGLTDHEKDKARLARKTRELEVAEALVAQVQEQQRPVLFVEGASDLPIIEAAWSAFFPGEKLPVTILPAGGTTQMDVLAGEGKALQPLLGDKRVLVLVDADGEGRKLAKGKGLGQGGDLQEAGERALVEHAAGLR